MNLIVFCMKSGVTSAATQEANRWPWSLPQTGGKLRGSPAVLVRRNKWECAFYSDYWAIDRDHAQCSE
jgi:hypothetical protein